MVTDHLQIYFEMIAALKNIECNLSELNQVIRSNISFNMKRP